MAKYIQLYLDTDFILPIGVGESGDFQKYIDQQASRRLWLYFSKSSSSGMFESNEVNKSNFDAGRDGYYGDFWKHIEKKDNIPGQTFPYIELLDLSRIISKLREWANVALFTETPEIVLNFSTVIPMKARRAFADYISQKLGKIRSYSIEINDLLSAKIIYDHQSLSPAFGEQLLIIQSAGRDILMSVQTWCGEQFMQAEEPVRLKKKGNEFLKEALAKIVVDHYEQTFHMLLPIQKEKEYIYQMQFADKWLNDRISGEDTFWVDNFHYSSNPGKVYPGVEIDGKQLDLIEKDAIRNTINDISSYYRKNIVNKHLHTILIGDVFKEDIFLNDCISVTSSDNKYTFFNDNATQEALGRYNVRYSTYTEDLSNLERIFMDKANERSRISTYVKNAEILGSIKEHVALVVDKIKTAVNTVKNRNSDLIESWDSYMKTSAFEEALKAIGKMSTSDDLFIAKDEAIDVLKNVERCNSLLIELQQLKEVAEIVNEVRDGESKLRELIKEAEELKTLPKTLIETTQKYRDLYGKYLELKRKFDSEPTLASRRNIIKEMQELTMEDMPVLDVAPIKGTIIVSSHKKGGFYGIGGKKVLTISLKIENPLPCKGVLIISRTTVSSIPHGRAGLHCIDVVKGAEGEVVNLSDELSAFGINNNANSIFIKFWPHEEEKIPINRFEICGGGTINI